jgi:hypothetical protein
MEVLGADLKAQGGLPEDIRQHLQTLSGIFFKSPLSNAEISELVKRCLASTGRPDSDIQAKLQAILEDVELFHNGDECFGTVAIEGASQTYPIKSGMFALWLRKTYFLAEGKALPRMALENALQTAQSIAQFKGEEKSIFVRMGHEGGKVYLDLGDAAGNIVEVDASGWVLRPETSVKFIRPRGMYPLPVPEAGGSIEELRYFVNVSDQDWPLLAAWLVASLMPGGPYPILVLHGEQGSAKTTTARNLKDLLDPSKAALRAEPRDAKDMMIACANNWIVALDNISHLQPWLSDVMCRISTGAGFATRQLYTDRDEVLIEVARPMLLNGIEELATRSDLVDRALVLYLPRIAGNARVTQESIQQGFEEARPRILGALLDAVSCALRRIQNVELVEPPRMADFARWVVAAEPGLDLEPGTFLAAYTENRAEANSVGLAASPFVKPLLEFIGWEKGVWEGIASDLLKGVEDSLGVMADAYKRKRGWPNNGNGVSNLLRRVAPNLRLEGYEVEFKRGRRRLIRIVAVRNAASSASSSVADVDAVDADDAAAQDGGEGA